jgi:signal transduction histidine kinase
VNLGRTFGDFKIRAKLMVVHNLFFLVLTASVYFSLLPLLEKRVAEARDRETALIGQIFSEERLLPRLTGFEVYDYREGDADALGIPRDIRSWLDTNPGSVWGDAEKSEHLYRKSTHTGVYRRLTIPHAYYERILARVRWTLFGVLGVIYLLAVLLLEKGILPAYVYRRLGLLLDADRATRRNDRAREMIPADVIPEDEIGQIMQSRNETVAELRRHEDDLAQALARLEAARKNLAEQDRLASLGLLSASVAHELNTPLAVMRGSIEKLMETLTDPQALERLARMLRVADRLRRISESLVDFARVRRGNMGPVPLRPLIDDAWSLVAIDERASQATFRNQLSPEHVVTGDPDRLAQVFVNLLRNSLAAVQNGGNITVRASANGEAILAVTVEDDGPGIPPEVLPNIFEAFVTSRLDARGTGLGLTVAEGIVQHHGGSISAANRPGGGAVLEVRLPMARAALSKGVSA